MIFAIVSGCGVSKSILEFFGGVSTIITINVGFNKVSFMNFIDSNSLWSLP